MNIIHVYTDGSWNTKTKDMGIGVLACMQLKKKEYRISRYIGKGTNNIAELTAIKIALQKLSLYKSNQQIIIYTDSQYCIGVLKRKWKVKANIDLIQEIKKLISEFDRLQFKWVRGHNGDEGNEIADKLALDARKKFENNQRKS